MSVKGEAANNRKDLSGSRFGKLEVIKFLHTDIHKKAVWLCLCDCGNFRTARGNHLRQGAVKSCGCLVPETSSEINTTHGMKDTRMYQIWCRMKARCTNPQDASYQLYGGRGISYQDSWENFEPFLSDMSEGYDDTLSLDRIDPNGGYTKENCRWATTEEQARNHRLGKNNTSGLCGVTYNKNRGQWCALWNTLDGKQRNRSFSVKKYGEELAFKLACEAREEEMVKLGALGAGYTEFHGK